MIQSFDAIVIGAGQAGPPLAVRLALAGQKVAIIERALFGGTCVNTGCTPTKTLVASAYAAHLARRAAEFGVVLGGAVCVDMKQVKARQDAVVKPRREGLEQWVNGQPGCTVIRGHARFTAPRQLSVAGEQLSADKVFINVGGRANVPPMPGVDQVPILTNTSVLELDVLPRRLVVVGGSYVGLEFAQIYRRFGAEVTVVEMGPRLIQREDPDASDAIKQILEAEGIQVRLSAKCIRFEPRGADICVGVVRIRTISTSRQLASRWTGAVTSWSTMRCRPAPLASGRWATATAGAPSPTPPTTTTRSSRTTCCTAPRAASATASSLTPCSLTRRSAAPA
jgi:pyruvate/2-oxoglutarate dehydrogenase complex dihydrolipoamide dehydrogenase (E3) component